MPFYLKMSQNISSTTGHLKFCYISIFYKKMFLPEEDLQKKVCKKSKYNKILDVSSLCLLIIYIYICII